MDNKKSSVEWYAKQSEILHYDYFTEHISKDEKNERLKQLKEQAKAMHKEEIENAYDDAIQDVRQDEERPLKGSEYYNIHFKKNG